MLISPQRTKLDADLNYIHQQATAYLPTHMNELMLREKSTATAKLPIVGSQTVVAIPRIDGTDYLLVASVDGYLFCYTLGTDGGECTLMRQYKIGPGGDDSVQESDLVGTQISTAEKQKSTSTLQRKTSIDSISSHSQPSSSVGSSVKPTPPPVPPAPKKRTESTNSEKSKKSETNPFDIDDFRGPSGDSVGSGTLLEIMPPADLNDLEEFPPLSHAT